jgi:hypothetical protein
MARTIPPLTPYADRSGSSGVTAYALEPRAIVVRFGSAATYRYSCGSAGEDAVATMKALAAAGRGLSTWISRHDPGYAERWIDGRHEPAA